MKELKVDKELMKGKNNRGAFSISIILVILFYLHFIGDNSITLFWIKTMIIVGFIGLFSTFTMRMVIKNYKVIFDIENNKIIYCYNAFKKDNLIDINTALVNRIILVMTLTDSGLILKIEEKIENKKWIDKLLDRTTKNHVLYLSLKENTEIKNNLFSIGLNENVIIDRRLDYSN